MKVISPTHLVLCRQSFLSLSGVEAEARGYDANQTHGFVYIVERFSAASEYTVEDPFDQTTGGRDNCVTHYKLPHSVYALNDAWVPQVSGVPGTHGFRSSFFMDGIVALSNGIVHGHAIMVQQVDNDNIIIGVAQPARGVRSSYWTIGDLYYYLLRLEEPTWSSRYGWVLGKISQMTRSATTVTELSEKRPYTGSPSCVSGAVALSALRQYIPTLTEFPSSSRLQGYRGNITPYIPQITDLFGEIDRAKSGRVNSWRRPLEHDELVARAFMDACNGISTLNQNSVGVLKETAEFLCGLLQGKIRFPDSPADAWLWYRYSFGTSIMDYEDYTKWIRQRASHYMERLGKNFRYRLYGHSSLDVNGIHVDCTCRIICKENNSTQMNAILHLLTEAGLDFNLADLWDLVPFSFIIDWLFPVGDVMQVQHDADYFTDERWNFDSITLSTKYSVMDPIVGDMGTRYDRWVLGSAPKVDETFWFSPDPVSGNTTCKRLLDTAALIQGIRESSR